MKRLKVGGHRSLIMALVLAVTTSAAWSLDAERPRAAVAGNVGAGTSCPTNTSCALTSSEDAIDCRSKKIQESCKIGKNTRTCVYDCTYDIDSSTCKKVTGTTVECTK